MDVTQTVRAWVAQALTGTIIGEVRLVGASNWGSRFGGGVFNANVSVGHLTSKDRTTLDWDAIEQVVEWCNGGQNSIVLTLGDVCLGEWWLLKREEGASASGTLPVTGIEWDGYPAFRPLEKDYIYGATDQLTIARNLLYDCFMWGQDTMSITVPSVASGVGRRMDLRRGQVYYSDALDELVEAAGGPEWRIVPTVTWAGGTATKVNRTVEFGTPLLYRESGITVDYDGPGFRSGNCIDFKQSSDFARSASWVRGVGSAQGEDQKIWDAYHTGLTDRGFVQTGKIQSWPQVTDIDQLGSLTRGARDAAMDLRDPARAVVLMEKLLAHPRVGDAVWVDAEPTYSLPRGMERALRLGEVSFSLNGHRASTVTVLGI